MPGHFEPRKSANGQFNFELKAGNGETILQTEQYQRKASAHGGIASVRANCADDARYERKGARKGQSCFTLKAANHQAIGSSETCRPTPAPGGATAVSRRSRTTARAR